MNRVIVQMLPALSGDCFIISCQGEVETINILVDMGFKSTYKNYLKEKIMDFKKHGQVIDLLVVSHIDQDHISGGLSFLEENGPSFTPKIIEIEEIWHNSFRHLRLDNTNIKALSREEIKKLQDYSNIVFREPVGSLEDISFKQGSTLASYILKGGYKWNSSFNNQAVCIDKELPEIKIKNATITLLSPYRENLIDLNKSWEAKLMEMGVKVSSHNFIDDAYEVYMLKKKECHIASLRECSKEIFNFEKLALTNFVEDSEMANASSIAFVFEWSGFKILMTGDAYSSVIEAGLNKYLQQGGNNYFDVVKISHHGSKRNTSLELLKRLKAKYYLISTNSGHHPDIETIARIIISNSEYKKIIFNYTPWFFWQINNYTLRSKYNYDLDAKNINFSNEKSSIVQLNLEMDVF